MPAFDAVIVAAGVAGLYMLQERKGLGLSCRAIAVMTQG